MSASDDLHPRVIEQHVANWDLEVDVLVLGSGAAGLTAALTASIEGLLAMLCEKTAHIGGTTALSGGEIWIPGNARGPEGSPPEDLRDAAAYLEAEAGSDAGRTHRKAYLASAAEAVDYLERHSDARFRSISPHPDYHQHVAGASLGGRPIGTIEFDGRKLGRDFGLFRPPRPDFMVLGGMMVSRDDIPPLLKPFASARNFFRAAQLVGRYAVDRLAYPRGTRLVMGNALVARMLYSLRGRGVDVATSSPLLRLICEDGMVTGAEVDLAGNSKRVRARLGVVLATGGFPSDLAMRQRYFGTFQANNSLGFEENKGEGFKSALAAGAHADTSARTPAAWMPASVMHWKSGRVSVFPHIRDRAKPGVILVNRDGRRFVNESASYHDVSLAMFEQQQGDPDAPAWLVCDRRFIGEYGIGLIKPRLDKLPVYEAAGYLIKAPTLPALAAALKIGSANLIQAVASHNAAAATGVDADFGKGATAYNRHYGDPSVRPNPCLRAIEVAPYYAVAVRPAPIGTYVGIATDANANALTPEGRRLHGLYACGNDMAAIARGAYPGPGSTIGPAIVFAYRAVMDMKRRNAT